VRPPLGRLHAALVWLCLGGCQGSGPAPTPDPTTVDAVADAAEVALDAGADALAVTAGLHVKMAFARDGALFSAPVPALDLVHTARTPRYPARATLIDWPGAAADPYLSLLLGPALEQGGLASQAGVIYLPLGGLDDGARAALLGLPDGIVSSAEAAATLGVIVRVDDGRARPQAWPFEWTFMADGGPFGAPDLLAIKPLPGIPFPPKTTVQIALTRALADLIGEAPGRDEGLAALLAGGPTPWADQFQGDSGFAPQGLAPGLHDAAYRAFIDDMSVNTDLRLAPADLLGAALVPIGDAAARFVGPARLALARDHATMGPFIVTEWYEDYCVAEAEALIPDYQHGELPFNDAGDGRWRLGADGAPVVAREARSRVFVTIPRRPNPSEPLPVAVFVRTGGGGDRPLIDRGLRAEAHGEPIIPRGDGPAKLLAQAGWVGLTWDGPHGGLRNVTGGDEQFLVFNMINPVPAIANIQQTAIEAVLVRRAFFDIVSTSPLPSCGDAAPITLREDRAVLMGHSMGAWITPIAMALDPNIEGAVMSGAGGAWIENVLYKLSPIATRPLAELILGYDSIGRPLTPFDPALTLLQWAGEAADPQIFGRMAMSPPRNVLVIQGIVDTYIMPPIAQALQASLGLDLALPALDRAEPRLASFPPLSDALALIGRGEVSRPVAGNRDSRTAIVVQLPEDGIEDGHEVFFQRADARHLWGCWLFDVAAGRVPSVRSEGATGSGGCPIE